MVAVLVLVLGGCSGDGGGSATSGTSVDPYEVAASLHATDSAAAPTATPSLSAEDQALRQAALDTPAPERPALVDENSPQGAVAAAEYFISLYPYVYATGNLTQWKTMSQEQCVFCKSVTDNVTELHEANGWIDSWTQTITATEQATDPADENRMLVHLTSEYTVGTRHEPPRSYDSGSKTNLLTVQLHMESGIWVIEEVSVA